MEKQFGHELRRYRGLAGLTMRDLAQEIGVSIVYISDIERGKRNPPSPANIRKMLIRVGKVEAIPEMLRLAAEARCSIEFKLDDADRPVDINLLLAFKRRLDQGDLDPRDVERIREILDEDIE